MQQQSNEQVNLQINTSLQSAPSTPPLRLSNSSYQRLLELKAFMNAQGVK